MKYGENKYLDRRTLPNVSLFCLVNEAMLFPMHRVQGGDISARRPTTQIQIYWWSDTFWTLPIIHYVELGQGRAPVVLFQAGCSRATLIQLYVYIYGCIIFVQYLSLE